MKKTFLLLLITVFLFAFVACDGNPSVNEPSGSGSVENGAFSIGSEKFKTLQDAVDFLATKSVSKDFSVEYTIKLNADVVDKGAVISGISVGFKIDFGTHVYTLANSSFGILIESNNAGVEISGGIIALGSGNSFSSVITAKGDVTINGLSMDVSSHDVDAVTATSGTLKLSGSTSIKTNGDMNAIAVSGSGVVKTLSDQIKVTGGLALKDTAQIDLDRGEIKLGTLTIEGASTTLNKTSEVDISVIDSSYDNSLETFNSIVQIHDAEWDNSMAYLFEKAPDNYSYDIILKNDYYSESFEKLIVPSVFEGEPVESVYIYGVGHIGELVLPISLKRLAFLMYVIDYLSIPKNLEDFFGMGIICAVEVAPEGKLTLSNDMILSSDGKTLMKCLPSVNGEVVIPDSVITVVTSAFYGCTGLTSITIPDSVTRIEAMAFSGCTGLTNITIPDYVTSIGDYAFNGCSSLTSITIPSYVTSIGNYAFYGCSSLTSITIPSSVTSIGNYVFYGCSSLTSITIPDSVTSIGYFAFYGCSSLTSITIPDYVTSIGDYAFYGCSSLTSITIPSSVTSIGNWAFYGCSSLTSITIPDSVTSIGSMAFVGCTGLTSITIPDSVTIIGSYAFPYCSSLTSITIPSSVTSIENYAFYGCSSLTSITIPDSVTSIGDYAFRDCESLTSITIPNSVTSIGTGVFNGCINLISIEVATDGVLSFSENMIFSSDGQTLIKCLSSASGDIIIPASVTSIGSDAFYGCSSLTSITIPDSVTSIGSMAFGGCTGLTSITIPSSVTSIGNWAFYGCTDLTDIAFCGIVTQWNATKKGIDWNSYVPATVIHCTDGDVNL